MEIHFNCRYYAGYKPCKFKRTCGGCDKFDPVESNILVIKLGALGDLLRTTPVLQSLKKAYPKSRITWLTQKSCVPLLAGIPEIDRIWETGTHVMARVLSQHFDIMINFDKDCPAAELAALSNAEIKRGFGLTSGGTLMALNPGSEYALRLGLDDELKFHKNNKTYQQIVHEMAELQCPSPAPPYRLYLSEEELAYGKKVFAPHAGAAFFLGVHAGCGRAFPTKKWPTDRFIGLLDALYLRCRGREIVPVLFGGADENEINDFITHSLQEKGIRFLRPKEGYSLREFASLVACCNGLVCGDTLAMHVGLAMGVRTLAIFTSTCTQEIELYGVGRIVAGKAPCAPCYLARCKQPAQLCADSLKTEDVFAATVEHMRLG
ncbi:MAG: hypothetical protein A2583_05220 [Bdellovibrionales bacterium RIFOXYD1_FULL_53_11]|nr:MAG: hypothetical protein A2583_05220 [Bdellovibrionales bacterium RIFOXYD1_FULL_53_11]